VVTPVVLPELLRPLNLAGIRAKSFLVYDTESGLALAEQNTDSSLPIASLTKLMTAYVAYQNVSLRQTIIINSGDQLDTSPALNLRSGDAVELQDLFNAMLVGSANDAAQAVANHTAKLTGKKFTTLMNDAASQLGMTGTRFSNPLGFDSETNYSTAADIQRLVQAIKQYPAFSLHARSGSYAFTSEQGTSYSVRATNKLVGTDREVYAIKTGYTEEALGAMVTEIRHNGHSFIIIVLASPDREEDTLKLKREIVKSYAWE
jgi:D-alanyl-D-alanine carboxypeptidase